jgi:hypothetical protein
MAVAIVMARCLLVYTLAEALLRQRLAQTGHTVPDQNEGQADSTSVAALAFAVFRGHRPALHPAAL